MPYLYEASCEECGLQAEVLWPPWALYQWPDGRTIEIAQQWVWCDACGSVRVGEALKAINQMDALLSLPIIAQAYDGEKKTWRSSEVEAALSYARYPRLTNLYENLRYIKRWNVTPSVILLNTLNLHLAWRVERVSPPRCLACGGTGITPLPSDADGEPLPILHTVCGGTIHSVKGRKMRARRALWNTEGEVIGLG